jgi:hypothetical protein
MEYEDEYGVTWLRVKIDILTEWNTAVFMRLRVEFKDRLSLKL